MSRWLSFGTGTLFQPRQCIDRYLAAVLYSTSWLDLEGSYLYYGLVLTVQVFLIFSFDVRILDSVLPV